MTLKITIPRTILYDVDKLCEFYAQLELEYGKAITSIKAVRLKHTIELQ